MKKKKIEVLFVYAVCCSEGRDMEILYTPHFFLNNFHLLNLWWDYPAGPKGLVGPTFNNQSCHFRPSQPSIQAKEERVGWWMDGRGKLIRVLNPASVVRDYGRGAGSLESTHYNSLQGKVKFSRDYYLVLVCPLFVFYHHDIWRRHIFITLCKYWKGVIGINTRLSSLASLTC